MQVREEQGLAELLLWRKNLAGSMPELQAALVKKLEDMAGEAVQLLADGPA